MPIVACPARRAGQCGEGGGEAGVRASPAVPRQSVKAARLRPMNVTMACVRVCGARPEGASVVQRHILRYKQFNHHVPWKWYRLTVQVRPTIWYGMKWW